MNWLGIALDATVIGTGGLLACLCGVAVVEQVFRLIDSDRGESPTLVAAGQQLRGGAWIGALERIAVYTCLVAAFPTGLAMVIAMKGLARYPELKVSSAGAAERFIIGTFVSILFAAACAGVALWTRSLTGWA